MIKVATIDFNINNEVWVKITEKGFEVLQKHFEKIFNGDKGSVDIQMTAHRPKPENNGYTRMPLWQLANYFGEHLFMGEIGLVIKTTIQLELKDLEGK